jgi:hypothetical protein
LGRQRATPQPFANMKQQLAADLTMFRDVGSIDGAST